MSEASAFEQELRRHDALLASLGLSIWMGGEPTFTDPTSYTAEWTFAALGEEKFAKAGQLAAALVRSIPGAMLLRTLGRQYPDEDCARWSFGCLSRKNFEALWKGPPDPLLSDDSGPHAIDALAFASALLNAFTASGAAGFMIAGATQNEARLVSRTSAPLDAAIAEKPEVLRPSIHHQEIPDQGAIDALAEEGIFLFVVRQADGQVSLELPAFPDFSAFTQTLRVIESASRSCGLSSLILQGFPPPTGSDVEWTTITPDPGVIEVNMAPCATALDFHGAQRRIYLLAADLTLAPMRLHYNGDLNDSGGGGHLTLGGPSPAESVFLTNSKLLPRLIALFVRHPCLSYLFNECVGPSSQAPRVDECARDNFHELQLALEILHRAEEVDAEIIWRSLSNFLVDRTGNSHRCEINIEKLANPWLAGRGRLGLVEFRALRMPARPERWSALAALWRSMVALCARVETGVHLKDWRDDLHDRFALPYWLDADLRELLHELNSLGFGVGEAIASELLDDHHRVFATYQLDDASLEVRKAFEFWPLVGDAGTQGGTSRLVDPSCTRLEFRIIDESTDASGPWYIEHAGYRAPLGLGKESPGKLHTSVLGVRYRTFRPLLSVHPLLDAKEPLVLHLWNGEGKAWRVTVRSWRNDGEAYDGLPAGEADGAERRAQRLEVESIDKFTGLPELKDFPAHARTAWCIDTRAL